MIDYLEAIEQSFLQAHQGLQYGAVLRTLEVSIRKEYSIRFYRDPEENIQRDIQTFRHILSGTSSRNYPQVLWGKIRSAVLAARQQDQHEVLQDLLAETSRS